MLPGIIGNFSLPKVNERTEFIKQIVFRNRDKSRMMEIEAKIK